MMPAPAKVGAGIVSGDDAIAVPSTTADVAVTGADTAIGDGAIAVPSAGDDDPGSCNEACGPEPFGQLLLLCPEHRHFLQSLLFF